MKQQSRGDIIIKDLIRVGSRPSPLAVAQVREVEVLLKAKGLTLQYDLVTFQTQGDRDKKTPLTSNVDDDFFTNTLDRALIAGKIDVAVHSAKDLPQAISEKLEVVALTSCLDNTDAWVSPVKFADLPAGAKVATSSFLRQDSIKAIRPDLKLVSVRGTIQERIELIRQKKVDGIIAATCALKRLKLDHLIADIFPWEGTPLQGQLAIVCRRNDITLKKIFSCIDVRRSYGKVFLVGAGPGDPGLITVKGTQILGRADCVFYDYLVDPALLKYAPRAEHIYVGKRKGALAIAQSELSRQIRLKAMNGVNVVRLKGGDPLIFGRGADEISYLRSFHVIVEVVPGVSSATGIPSLLGIPLTARGVSSSVAFVSAHGEDERTAAKGSIHIPDTETVVFLMGLSKLPQIVSALKRKKRSLKTPVAVISKGTRREQVVVTGDLQSIQTIVSKNSIQPPALIIAGNVVGFYRSLTPSKNVLFLGTHPQGYRSLGRLIHFPMIRILPVQMNRTQSKRFLELLRRSTIILLTSEYAVEHFMDFLERHHGALDLVGSKDFAVIGAHTAQSLLDRGIHPKVIASDETSEGMFAELTKKIKVKGKDILFPRSSLPNPFLKNALTKAGAKVHQFAIYRNVKPTKRPLPDMDIEAVVFTSPSTVNGFIKDYAKIPPSWEILCKGPASQRVLKKYGYASEIIG